LFCGFQKRLQQMLTVSRSFGTDSSSSKYAGLVAYNSYCVSTGTAFNVVFAGPYLLLLPVYGGRIFLLHTRLLQAAVCCFANPAPPTPRAARWSGLPVFENGERRVFEDFCSHWKENHRILVQRRMVWESMLGGMPEPRADSVDGNALNSTRSVRGSPWEEGKHSDEEAFDEDDIVPRGSARSNGMVSVVFTARCRAVAVAVAVAVATLVIDVPVHHSAA
jgi:hypothetical protein